MALSRGPLSRRDFAALLGGAATVSFALPREAHAQQPAIPVVGFLRSTSLATATHLVTAFRQSLKETGFIEGQNVAIEFRSAEEQLDRLPALVADLLRRRVAVIVGDNTAAIAAKAATTSVPIVFAGGGDPIEQGLVASLNRPGGNVTGVSMFAGALGAKRLELLRRLVPNATTIAMLVNPEYPTAEVERRDVQAAAQAIRQQLTIINVTSNRDIDTAFTTLVQRGAGALLVGVGPFMTAHRERLVALAARHALPTIYFGRAAVVAGGLMSYATSITDAYRQVGLYAGRILKGEKPAELPVMRSTKFELVFNLKTAKTLGLDIPPNLLALADEVIE
jgi:putative ABC transport system substrate-binding protein